MKGKKETENKDIQDLIKGKKKGKIVPIFLTVVTFIIIWLLFQRFSAASIEVNKPVQVPTGNIDIFEIKCNDNCSCTENNQFNQTISKLDNDSNLSNIFISSGNLNFNKNTNNYNILLENDIDKITLNGIKNSEKSTLYYIYNKKVYSSFKDMPILVGENIITIAVIAENGNLTSYRIVVTRLDKTGEIVTPVSKDTNNNLTNITISNGNLFFEKNKFNYTVLLDSNVDKITLTAIRESDKATITYIYNGKNYSEFKDVEISDGNNFITILVTAENGSTVHYTVTIIKKSSSSVQVDGLQWLQWYSKNDLNIFSNPAYNGESIIAPGSTNSYEFIIRNKVNKKVKYRFDFEENSNYEINMKYRLKRNGDYIVGNEETWVSYSELNLVELEVDYNKADDYILDWKWFDGENDSLIGKLQKDYTLSITLSAIIQE